MEEDLRRGNAVSCEGGCAPSSSLKPIRVVANRRSFFHTLASLVHRHKVSLFLPQASKRNEVVPYGVNRHRETTTTTIVPVRRVGTVGIPLHVDDDGTERIGTFRYVKDTRNRKESQQHPICRIDVYYTIFCVVLVENSRL